MTASLHTSQSHPPSIDLEAFACGEQNDTVAAHVATCDSCKAFTTEIESATRTFAIDPTIDEMVARLAASASKEPGESHVPVPSPVNVNVNVNVPGSPTATPAPTPIRRLDTALRVLPFLAMAAGVLLWMRLSETTPDLHPQASPVAANTSQTNTDTTGTAFKGGTQLAVIRERDGTQKRFTGEVPVRKGDRLRIEVALDHSANILGGVLAEDGTFLDLLHEGQRGTGTFYSEEAARFDDSPTRGYVIVGPKDIIEQARANFPKLAPSPGAGPFDAPSSNSREGTASLRVVWEGP